MFLLLLLSRHLWPTFSLFRHRRREDFNRGLIFLDLDGTLWPDMGPGGLLNISKPSAFLREKFPRSGLQRESRKIVFVTNQTFFSRQTTIELSLFISYILKVIEVIRTLNAICLLVCHHHPNATNAELRLSCIYRKPSGLLIDKFYKLFPFNKENSIFVGDRITDMLTAENSGIGRNLLIMNDNMFDLNEHNSNIEQAFAFFSVIANFDNATLESIQG